MLLTHKISPQITLISQINIKKMILRFNATECGMMTQDSNIICGASNTGSKEKKHSLIFCGPETNDCDSNYGVYFEIDDQSQGGENNLKEVRLIQNKLLVIPLPEFDIPYTEINVNLNCSDDNIEEFKTGLRLVFRNSPDKLHITD